MTATRYTGGGDNINERVASAFKFVEEVIAAEPAYAMVAPSFKAYFERLKNHNANYIAHEYLNLDWDLMYFADVAELCQTAKLEFATVAFPAETGTAYLGEKGQEFFKKISNPIVREQLKDYFINRQFRKDIYVRGVRRLSNTEVFDKIFSMRYVLTTPAAEVPMTMVLNGREIILAKEIYRPLLEYLQEDNFRPKDLREYFMRGKLNANQLLEALRLLVQAAHITPCQSDAAVKRAKKSCERLNAHICEKSSFADTIRFLASPLTGGGVEVGRFHQIFLAQYKAGNKTADKLAEAAWKIISRNGERMMAAQTQKLLETDAENLAYLETMAEKFLTRLPIYKALML
ncbi:MAG: methyltransferase regulatory domain-containing protein [Quinella sp. 3Q1]|nr:methyltransferase regulatory domain-containing protein [Quinella sp. 3Q1]